MKPQHLMDCPPAERSLTDWLRTQDAVLEAWSTALVCGCSPDLALVERIETHRRWLAEERSRIEGRDTHSPSRSP